MLSDELQPIMSIGKSSLESGVRHSTRLCNARALSGFSAGQR